MSEIKVYRCAQSDGLHFRFVHVKRHKATGKIESTSWAKVNEASSVEKLVEITKALQSALAGSFIEYRDREYIEVDEMGATCAE